MGKKTAVSRDMKDQRELRHAQQKILHRSDRGKAKSSSHFEHPWKLENGWGTRSGRPEARMNRLVSPTDPVLEYGSEEELSDEESLDCYCKLCTAMAAGAVLALPVQGSEEEPSLLDMARPAKVKGIAKEFEVLPTVSQVVALEDELVSGEEDADEDEEWEDLYADVAPKKVSAEKPIAYSEVLRRKG